MNILSFLLNLIPASFSISVPAESFGITIGSTKLNVSSPPFAVTITKG